MLASGLFLVSQRLGPVEAGRYCAPVLSGLVTAFNRSKERYYSFMAEGLVTVLSGLEVAQARKAMRICGDALTGGGPDSELRQTLRSGFTAAGIRSGPEEMARLMSIRIDREQDVGARQHLVSSLTNLAETMTNTGAASPADTSKMLIGVLESIRDKSNRPELMSGLARLVEKLPDRDASELCPRAARAITIGADTHWAPNLSSHLEVIASRMNAVDAHSICQETIRGILKRSGAVDLSIVPLLRQLHPETAKHLATELASWACAQGDIDVQNLDTILSERGRRDADVRDAGGIVTTGETEQPKSTSLPCRLATQSLVELLKMPTCFGEARAVVLDHLSNRYGRRFYNHWAFVRFAEEQDLGLDFTTPPKRPDPKESVKRMLEIVSEPTAGR